MSKPSYDVIVLGARCAGSPVAMLLAKQGHRVLLVDRARFPSDTVSTHLIHPPGVSALRRWGLLDRLAATGCPAIRAYRFDFGPFALEGAPGPKESPVAYAPRRTVLDKLLLDAAGEAGVEVREGFVVEEVLVEDGRVTGLRGVTDGGTPVTERARIVVGADGVHSMLARAVDAPRYSEIAPLQAGYYSYWSGLPMDGRFEAYDRSGRAWAVWPTNDDLTLIVVSWPFREFETNRNDVERHFLETLERAPDFAERVRGAKREERFVGTMVPNFFRRPYGPGWALVGDAGYTRDFMTAQGISDAFLDAERMARAIGQGLAGERTFEESLAGAQAERDAKVQSIFEFTCQFAKLEPPSEQQQQLFAAIRGNREAMDGFAQVISGVIPPSEYFEPGNVGRIFEAAAAR